MPEALKVKIGDRWYTVEVVDLDADPVRVLVDGEPVQVTIDRTPETSPVLPGASDRAVERQSVAPPMVRRPPAPAPAAVERPAPGPAPARAPARAPGAVPGAQKLLSAPMPGIILSVRVEAGDTVVTGDEICVLEAMKMQQNLRSDWSGVIKTVHVEAGQQVLGGDPIAELE